MDWRDGYLQARFRDAEFYIKGADYKTGRRNVKHIYPRVDKVDHEDMGQHDKTFSLDAYILGDDYYAQRDKLEAALDLGGTGILVHPYRGVFQVVVNNYGESERTNAGRRATFKIDFSIQEVTSLTTVQDNTLQLALDSKKSFLDAVAEWFEDVYDLASKPVTAIQDARAGIDQAFRVMDAAKRTVGAVAEFKRELENARGSVIALSLNAKSLVTSMQRICNFGTDTSSTPGAPTVTSDNARDQTREQRQIAAFKPEVIAPEDIAEDSNYPSAQIQKLVAYQATGSLIGLVPFVPYTSVNEVQQAQDSLFEAMDELMADPSIPDTIYGELRDAKKNIFNDLQTRLVTLPRLVAITLPAATNALTLSYELYGNTEEVEDIANRNDIIHPGFLPAAVPLQVKVGRDE